MSDPRNDGFSKLFSESREALRRYVQRLVKSKDATEEIVQEAFLRTYEQGARVQTPRAFLFSIARNLAWKSRRHDRVVEEAPIEGTETAGIYKEYGSPEDRLLADERIRLLKEAVERLPPQCRAAFTLKVFHDYSYQEIAERLGVSRKTVEKHISAGLRATHGFLKEQP